MAIETIIGLRGYRFVRDTDTGETALLDPDDGEIFRAGDTFGIGSATIGPDKRPWGDRVDVFAIGGQSNAIGHGSDTSVTPDLAADVSQSYHSGELHPLSDPIAPYPDEPAAGGSAWPMFAKRYYELEGRPTVFCTEAYGGSSITTDGIWSSSGNQRDALISTIDETMAHLNSLGYDPRFRGILWNQGEADESKVNDGTITVSDYETAFNDLIAYFDANLSHGPYTFGVFELGYGQNDDGVTEDLRRVQRNAVRSTDNATFLSDFARGFGSLHYESADYNAWGKDGSERLATGDVLPTRRACTIRLSTASPIGGGWTNIPFDTVGQDEFGQFAPDSNAIVVEEHGDYLVGGQVTFQAPAAAADVLSRIWVNESFQRKLIGNRSEITPASDVDRRTVNLNQTMTELNAGDSITFQAAQKTGSNLDTSAEPHHTFLSVTPVGQ